MWGVSGGQGLTFATDVGRVAISVCYDSNSLLARTSQARGAEVILVPSCTDAWRLQPVRIGCQAQALENQCYVVQSPTVGDCLVGSVGANVGYAAVYRRSTVASRRRGVGGVA